ncbi:hypothetical protein [Dyadobacter pollutisoli]|uniref:Beta-lactamase-inhibitor-like PepSY-like domain-containing protein n=1 Tax=Dyadobacter pollutisoli TaxID=2910158 RepID=A0A9E8NGS1_9BACT|nr:hypothetical protein [Dyadobacter pollutisoli]WAC14676.1 hypothetical protein ON006_12085 [Dyadobacter pollutisoli]
MKNLIASALVAIFAIATVQVQAQNVASNTKKEIKAEKREARHNAPKNVSVKSKNSFLSDFGNVGNVTWVATPQFDEATFTKDGTTLIAYYDYQSQLVGTTSNKKIADLPAKALKEIQKQYKDYVIGAVVEFKDNEKNDTNMMLYGTQFDDEDHYFVTISKGKHEDVLKISLDGNVSFFRTLS